MRHNLLLIKWLVAEVPAGAGAGGGGAHHGGGDEEAEAHHQARRIHPGSEQQDGNT